MGRLLRLAISAFCLLCLLACLGTAWLWRHSYRTPPGGEFHASMLIQWRHARYTVRSESGRLTLFAPPPPPAKNTVAAPQPGQPALDGLAAQISNQQLEWQVARVWATDRPPSFRANVSPRPRFGTPVDMILTEVEHDFGYGGYGYGMRLIRGPSGFLASPAATPPMLQAIQSAQRALQARLLRDLEEPERALAAHLILTKSSPAPTVWLGRSATADRLEALPDGSFVQTMGGIRVRLRPDRPFSPIGPGNDVEARLCSASLEPAQLTTARDMWHRRLDVPVGSVPHWPIVAVTGLGPLAWFSVVLRRASLRRRRKRRGLCPRCGYDLTGNISGKCSECGQPVERKVLA